MALHPFAMASVLFGLGGWLIFLSLFLGWLPIERLFPTKANWALLLLLLLALLCSISAIVLGHKSYVQIHDNSMISGTVLTCAGLALGYAFWFWFGRYAPANRWAVLSLLLALSLLCILSAIYLGYMSCNTFMALAGLVLGYIHLPVLLIGILFAIVPWHNSYRS